MRCGCSRAREIDRASLSLVPIRATGRLDCEPLRAWCGGRGVLSPAFDGPALNAEVCASEPRETFKVVVAIGAPLVGLIVPAVLILFVLTAWAGQKPAGSRPLVGTVKDALGGPLPPPSWKCRTTLAAWWRIKTRIPQPWKNLPD